MEKPEKIEDFYNRKFNWIPESFRREIGHFNVFRLDQFVGKHAQPVPYRRRDFYKIMLVIGSGKVCYADKVIEVNRQALTFSNPRIPYKWENTNNIDSGFFCIFNDHFFHQFGDISQYSIFKPEGNPIFELTSEQNATICKLFERMFEEIESDYLYKYDILRNLVFELIHFAMKMQPSSKLQKQPINAAQRVSTLFLELLERQFPIEESNSKIRLRTASDFATQLNIHVNHLNRALKETSQKSTSQIISERILKESKILLKNSKWNISEISHSLGFNETTYFNSFFKKHTRISPSKFRNL